MELSHNLSYMEGASTVPGSHWDMTTSMEEEEASILEVALVSTVVIILSVLTTAGNLIVIMSFKLDSQLQTVSNYFLISLSIADFAIGCVSMPLFSVYLLMRHWPLGSWLCDTWLALDYTMSNASVANLLVISFDRYFSVTRPLTYRAHRTGSKAVVMIVCAWIVSLLLWTPWIYAWPYLEGKRTVPDGKCYIQFLETNKYITIMTALAAFYLPVTIMAVLFGMIYRETEKRQKGLAELQGGKPLLSRGSSSYSQDKNSIDDLSDGFSPTKIQKDNMLGSRSTSVYNSRYMKWFRRSCRCCCSKGEDSEDNPNSVSEKHSDKKQDSQTSSGRKWIGLIAMSSKTKQSDRSRLRDPGLSRRMREENYSCRRLIHDDDRDSPVRYRAMNSAPSRSSDSELVEQNPCQNFHSSVPKNKTYFVRDSIDSNCLKDDRKNELGARKIIEDNNKSQEFVNERSQTNEGASTISKHSNQLISEMNSQNLQQCKSIANSVSFQTKSSSCANDSDKIDTVLPESKPNKLSLKEEEPLIRVIVTSPSNEFTKHTAQGDIKDDNNDDGTGEEPRRQSEGEEFAIRVSRERRPAMTMQQIVLQAKATAKLREVVRAKRARRQHQEKQQDRKAAKTLSAILLAFVITWSPYNIFTVIQVFCTGCIPETLYNIGYWLCYINSTINPLCYALCNANFRRTYWRILTCQWVHLRRSTQRGIASTVAVARGIATTMAGHRNI